MNVSARVYHCTRCHCQVFICRWCDRGNVYCAGGCAQHAHRGTPLSRATAELVQLLDDYGAHELEQAINEALSNDVSHPSGVRQVLERRREQRDRPPPITLTLPENDKARNIVVRAPSLALYDQLNPDTDDDPEPEHTDADIP